MKEAAPTVPDASGNYSQTNIQVQELMKQISSRRTEHTFTRLIEDAYHCQGLSPGKWKFVAIDFKDENFTPARFT